MCKLLSHIIRENNYNISFFTYKKEKKLHTVWIIEKKRKEEKLYENYCWRPCMSQYIFNVLTLLAW